MSQAQRPPANRMALMQFKARVVGAKKGWQLLKKKRDALKTRFQAMLREIIDCKKQLGPMMVDCAFSIAKAEWASETEFASSILSRVKKPSVTVKISSENVAGVHLPTFIPLHDETKDASLETLGIARGGQVLQSSQEQHRLALILFVKLASLQTSFKTLDEEIKMTSRRVAALEYVVIPKIEEVIAWIKQEMDEMEREEFFRVKKVVEKKKQRDIVEKARAALEASEKASVSVKRTNSMQRMVPPTVLPAFTQAKDPDVIF